MNIKFFIQVIMFISISFRCILIQAQSESRIDERFKEFLECFQNKSLPLKLDRKETFELATNSPERFLKVTNKYKEYLPEELQTGSNCNNFRCLYALDKYFDYIPLLIAKDYFEENDQRQLEVFLVIFDTTGTIHDYKLIAGFIIDSKETFTTVDTDYLITINQYQFKYLKDNKYPRLFNAEEIIETCHLNKLGKINCSVQKSTSGYFEGDWTGYKLIHQE